MAIEGGHAVLGVAMTYSTLLATVSTGSRLTPGWSAASSKLATRSPRPARNLLIGAQRALRIRQRNSLEAGKYVLRLVLVIVLARFVRPLQRSFVPLLYLFVLLPSCAIAVWQLGPGLGRSEIAGTLAGPVALGVAALGSSARG